LSDTPTNGTLNGTRPPHGNKGNTNAIRHGMRGGKLPPGCGYIEIRVNNLRREVEAAVVAQKGQIDIVDAAAVNSILKWERHGLLAAHWLRREADKLSAADRLRFSEAIAKASDQRDRNIRALGLGLEQPINWVRMLSQNQNNQNNADGSGGAEDK
jgi:hypothetical protein